MPITGILALVFSMNLLANASQETPFLEPMCDARMIAQSAPTLSKTEYLEVIDALETTGAIDNKYAVKLRGLIEEAYAVSDLQAWTEKQCSP